MLQGGLGDHVDVVEAGGPSYAVADNCGHIIGTAAVRGEQARRAKAWRRRGRQTGKAAGVSTVSNRQMTHEKSRRGETRQMKRGKNWQDGERRSRVDVRMRGENTRKLACLAEAAAAGTVIDCPQSRSALAVAVRLQRWWWWWGSVVQWFTGSQQRTHLPRQSPGMMDEAQADDDGGARDRPPSVFTLSPLS